MAKNCENHSIAQRDIWLKRERDVSFVIISFQARFCFQISYPAILITMLLEFLYCGSYTVHALLPGTSKAFTLSVLLPDAYVHILLPGTQQYLLTFSSSSRINYFKNCPNSQRLFSLWCRLCWAYRAARQSQVHVPPHLHGGPWLRLHRWNHPLWWRLRQHKGMSMDFLFLYYCRPLDWCCIISCNYT